MRSGRYSRIQTPNGTSGCGEPVRVLVLTGVLVLDIEVERAVVVVVEWVTIAERESVDLVGDLEPVGVVDRCRPERPDGRQFVSVEVHDVVVVAAGSVAVGVGEQDRIHRVLGRVRTKAERCDDRTLHVEVAVHAHRVDVHLPTVHDVGQARDRLLHGVLRSLGCVFEHGPNFGIEVTELRVRHQADAAHLLDECPVAQVRRMQREQAHPVGEEVGRAPSRSPGRAAEWPGRCSHRRLDVPAAPRLPSSRAE